MAAATKYVLAPTGSAANIAAGTSVETTNIVEDAQIAFQFVVETASGGTQTVTYKYQGSLDGANWFDVIYYTDANDTLSVATRTVTAVGATVQWLDGGNSSRMYKYFRVVTSGLVATITYRAELYAFNIPR